MLVIAQIAQGIGAAAIMGVTTALMRVIFPPEHIGRGMSINTMVVAMSRGNAPGQSRLLGHECKYFTDKRPIVLT